MSKYAAIDIGTNSMRLLLAEIKDGRIVEKAKEIDTTRIGSSVDQSGCISEEGILRNISALETFAKKAKEFGAEHILAIATSAVRDAKNGREFVKRAEEITGVKIEVISGEKEASLGYRGVAKGLEEGRYKNRVLNEDGNESIQIDDLDRKNLLVIDIGGGSTELILGQGSNLEKTISLNVGAVRMTERHIYHDPITKEEKENMEEDINKIASKAIDEINEELSKKHSRHEYKKNNAKPTLIGIGGTITTLAALHQELDPYDSDKVHNYKLKLKDIVDLRDRLSSLRVEEIRSLKGIHPKRADIILAGITILIIIMENLNIYDIVVSEYDNLEGLLFPRT